MTKPDTVNGISVKVLAGIEETQRRSQEVCARKRRYSDEYAARVAKRCTGTGRRNRYTSTNAGGAGDGTSPGKNKRATGRPITTPRT